MWKRHFGTSSNGRADAGERDLRDALTANERERGDVVVFPCNAAAAISLKGGVKRVFYHVVVLVLMMLVCVVCQ